MRADNVPAALDHARRLLRYVRIPPYSLDTQNVPDLENPVKVMGEATNNGKLCKTA